MLLREGGLFKVVFKMVKRIYEMAPTAALYTKLGRD